MRPNFKFRAGCQRDALAFATFAIEWCERKNGQLSKCDIDAFRMHFVITRWENPTGTENEIEIDTSIPLDQLIELIDRVDDGHVMAETLAGIDEYTGKRTYRR